MHKKIYNSLPVQLLVLNLKHNKIILFLWLILFFIITNNFGNSYGVPYLFLDPEYLNEVNFKSLFILGFAFSIFSMSFHITVYILESYRFQFLMIKRDPFARFCLNNLLIPTIFHLMFVYNFVSFQINHGCQDYMTITQEIAGFLIGYYLTITATLLYFKLTANKLFNKFAHNLNESLRGNKITRIGVIDKIRMQKRKPYHVDYYLDFPLKIKKNEGFIPYNKSLITKVIDQNHLNALLLEISGFIFILVLGYFRDTPLFQIPAGASILILFSIITMFVGASTYWLKGWTLYVLIGLIIALNYTIQYQIFNPDYEAFGLNYETKPAEYSFDRISYLSSDTNYHEDFNHTIKMLENWKAKFPDTSKPKMIFICTSGGGQRAALWTLRTLQVVDSAAQGEIMNHTFFISGASGGIIGASYYRELYLRQKLKENINIIDKKYPENIAKDILNPIILTLIVNDMFYRFEKFSDGKYEYIKDRGYAFEKQLNLNTEKVMDRKVADYKIYEEQSIIPMLLLSPSIINDGRKLFISPQPISFLNSTGVDHDDQFHSRIKGIEFMRFFNEQDAANLGFLSALRMSASFPYVTPNVNLPCIPSMEVMDAGLTDNYGIIDAVRFSHIFRNWIKANTSGVIFMCIRDSPKFIPINKKLKATLLDRVINPIGSLYSNWNWIQDNNDEYFLEYAKSFLGTKMDVIEFQYSPLPKNMNNHKLSKKELDEIVISTWKDRASLSWHLTRLEKESLKETIYNNLNWSGVLTMKELLNVK